MPYIPITKVRGFTAIMGKKGVALSAKRTPFEIDL